MNRDQWFPNGSSRILALGARLAVGSLAFISSGACGSAPQPESGAAPTPPVVQVAEADRSLRAMQTEVVGTVRAAREATIAPLLSGTVTEVRVRIRSGQFGRALLTAGKSFMVTVPFSAVARRGQLEIVFVIDEGTARLRLVRTGLPHGGRVEIFAGLSGGEKVALAADAGLADGQRVRVQGPEHAEVVR